MKENDRDLEMLLKNKMDELSESVDCFDKISARVFSEEDQDFSESGFTVSDLDTVTPRHRVTRIIKWTAAAVAAAVCIAFIPATGIPRKIMSDLTSGKSDPSFNRLLDELNYELDNYDYCKLNLSLKQYRDYDALITPLFDCPFKDVNTKNKNVQIFIKQINGIDTNQVYAVEYTGIPCEEHIVAIAAPKYRFTDEEIREFLNADTKNFKFNDMTSTVDANFTLSDNGYTDAEGNDTVVASFSHPMFFKNDFDVQEITANVLYGCTDKSSYFYDTIVTGYRTGDMNMFYSDMWDRSLYTNGDSAMPEERNSLLSKVKLFGNVMDNGNGGCSCIFPYESGLDTSVDVISGFNEPVEIALRIVTDDSTFDCQGIMPPLRTYDKNFMAMYVKYNGMYNGHIVMTTSVDDSFFGVLLDDSCYTARQEDALRKMMMSNAENAWKNDAVRQKYEQQEYERQEYERIQAQIK